MLRPRVCVCFILIPPECLRAFQFPSASVTNFHVSGTRCAREQSSSPGGGIASPDTKHVLSREGRCEPVRHVRACVLNWPLHLAEGGVVEWAPQGGPLECSSVRRLTPGWTGRPPADGRGHRLTPGWTGRPPADGRGHRLIDDLDRSPYK